MSTATLPPQTEQLPPKFAKAKYILRLDWGQHVQVDPGETRLAKDPLDPKALMKTTYRGANPKISREGDLVPCDEDFSLIWPERFSHPHGHLPQQITVNNPFSEALESALKSLDVNALTKWCEGQEIELPQNAKTLGKDQILGLIRNALTSGRNDTTGTGKPSA